jgi:hypothetical protein
MFATHLSGLLEIVWEQANRKEQENCLPKAQTSTASERESSFCFMPRSTMKLVNSLHSNVWSSFTSMLWKKRTRPAANSVRCCASVLRAAGR